MNGSRNSNAAKSAHVLQGRTLDMAKYSSTYMDMLLYRCSLRFCRRVFIGLNGTLFAASTAILVIDFVYFSFLLSGKSIDPTLFGIFRVVPWKDQVYLTHTIALLVAVQSSNALIAILTLDRSSLVKLSISNTITVSYFFYPLMYYLETEDPSSSLLLSILLAFFLMVSLIFTKSVEEEIDFGPRSTIVLNSK